MPSSDKSALARARTRPVTPAAGTKPGNKRGRPPLFTKDVRDTIIKHLRSGAFKRHAARAAGVSEDALAQWLKRGQAGEKLYAGFAREVDRVIAEDAIRNQAIITAAAIKPIAGNWKAAVWNLETKHPTLYGRAAGSAVAAVTVATDGDADAGTKTRIEFYLPDNGRRPDIIADDEDEEDEEEA